jgi:hypothetical protein
VIEYLFVTFSHLSKYPFITCSEWYLSEGFRLEWSRKSVLRTLTDHKVVTVITGSQDAFLYQKKKAGRS